LSIKNEAQQSNKEIQIKSNENNEQVEYQSSNNAMSQQSMSQQSMSQQSMSQQSMSQQSMNNGSAKMLNSQSNSLIHSRQGGSASNNMANINSRAQSS
jgi:hypothetical protein